MSNTQADRVEGLAAQHGTRYVNRHFPNKASYGFSQEQLQAFVAALVTENEALRADAERLDWLEKTKRYEEAGGGTEGRFTISLTSMRVPTGPDRKAEKGFNHKSLRLAIDAARNTTQ